MLCREQCPLNQKGVILGCWAMMNPGRFMPEFIFAKMQAYCSAGPYAKLTFTIFQEVL
jgi:hypothetical protein